MNNLLYLNYLNMSRYIIFLSLHNTKKRFDNAMKELKRGMYQKIANKYCQYIILSCKDNKEYCSTHF